MPTVDFGIRLCELYNNIIVFTFIIKYFNFKVYCGKETCSKISYFLNVFVGKIIQNIRDISKGYNHSDSEVFNIYFKPLTKPLF